MTFRRFWLLAGLVAVSACQSGQVAESDPALINNRAETLRRAADAATDELIAQINVSEPDAPDQSKNLSQTK